jgi:hypothetical protein
MLQRRTAEGDSALEALRVLNAGCPTSFAQLRQHLGVRAGTRAA